MYNETSFRHTYKYLDIKNNWHTDLPGQAITMYFIIIIKNVARTPLSLHDKLGELFEEPR